MAKTIAIFGGSQEQSFKKLGKKAGFEVLFHGGKTRNGGNKKSFKTLIEKSDCIVVLYGACGHVSMDMIKEISKKEGKNVIYQKGFGASGAIQACTEYFKQVA